MAVEEAAAAGEPPPLLPTAAAITKPKSTDGKRACASSLGGVTAQSKNDYRNRAHPLCIESSRTSCSGGRRTGSQCSLRLPQRIDLFPSLFYYLPPPLLLSEVNSPGILFHSSRSSCTHLYILSLTGPSSFHSSFIAVPGSLALTEPAPRHRSCPWPYTRGIVFALRSPKLHTWVSGLLHFR